MNWKNILMEILDAVGEAEGTVFEHLWQMPQEIKDEVKKEYALWQMETYAAAIHNQNEIARIELEHGVYQECLCSLTFLKSADPELEVDCPIHGTIDATEYWSRCRDEDFNSLLQKHREAWFKERGALFKEEVRTPPDLIEGVPS